MIYENGTALKTYVSFLDGMGIIRGLSKQRNVLPFEGGAGHSSIFCGPLNQALRADNPGLWVGIVVRSSHTPISPKKILKLRLS
jgi:hypothetical protein